LTTVDQDHGVNDDVIHDLTLAHRE
jgi:hypothetical protein